MVSHGGKRTRLGPPGDAEGPSTTAGDVFPRLGLLIVAGLILGAALGGGPAWFGGRPVAMQGSYGALAGVIVGTFVGLSRAVWRPGLLLTALEPFRATRPQPQAEPAQPEDVHLWDDWLDGGHDLESAGAPSPEEAVRAVVRPRVISPTTGEAILLHDEIGSLISLGRVKIVWISGGPGAGKTTALQYLDRVLPPWAKVVFHDRTDPAWMSENPADHQRSLLIMTTPWDLTQGTAWPIVGYRLAPWSRDDLIEYLLTAGDSNPGSVMSRLADSGGEDFPFLQGIPELWTLVLDRMACDPSIGAVRSALRLELESRLSAPSVRTRVQDLCLGTVLEQASGVTTPGEVARSPLRRMPHFRLLRHRPAQLLLGTERLMELIAEGRGKHVLARPFPRDLVEEMGRRIAQDRESRVPGRLRDWLRHRSCHDLHPMAASLLHAARDGWRPDPSCVPRLDGAYLEGATWPGVNLEGADLRAAHLEHADLSGGNLERAYARNARLSGANLRAACLDTWDATEADLSGADLREVRGDYAQFPGAILAGANLEDASLRQARFPSADLRGARLGRANLWKADFENAQIGDADLTRAILKNARLNGLDLRLVRLVGAVFEGAFMKGCNLEGVELDAPDFQFASLRGADLTASVLPRANLQGADLSEARLADVRWPGACLRDANLSHASFHAGTARDGLVGSPIPCEGSRTGFYTDDYDDRYFVPPEEIRKANLRGADLRGARIWDVDFYLVDLREARYSEAQASHFRACGAILDDRGT